MSKFLTIICKQCGKKINRRHSLCYGKRGKFCSRECYQKYRQPPASKCLICGRQFKRSLSERNAGYNKFCSRKCHGVWMSKNWRGKKHPCWKGGYSNLLRQIHYTEKYKHWRLKIFRRDKFTCQLCGTTKGRIEVHHKKPFRILIKEMEKVLPLFGIREAAELYTPLWDIDNGIVLCRKCHMLVEPRFKQKERL